MQRRARLAPLQPLQERLNHRQRILSRDTTAPTLPQTQILPTDLAELVPAPGLPAPRDELLQVSALDTPPQRFALRIVHADVQGPEAGAAEPDVVSRALAHAGAGAGVARLGADVEGAAADEVAAGMRRRAGEAVEVVVLEVGFHVAQSHDLVAQVAFRRPCAVG